MLEEITNQYSPEKLERKIQDFWEKSDAYSKVREHRRGGKSSFSWTGRHIPQGTSTWALHGTR